MDGYTNLLVLQAILVGPRQNGQVERLANVFARLLMIAFIWSSS